jgi:WD40 repeat protein/Ca2+-binding EF-hand superfamily protein
MGQILGRASFSEGTLPFVNLQRNAVYDLWESFNDVAEGFGINIEEFKEICSVLQAPLGNIRKPALERLCEALFDGVLDTDCNGLIDALEALAAITIVSGLSKTEKLLHVFNLFDFDESCEVTIDEMTLLLKSTIMGACKLSLLSPPDERSLESLSQEAFAFLDKDKDNCLTRQEFIEFCGRTPEIHSWLLYFDDAIDISDELTFQMDSDVDGEGLIEETNIQKDAARCEESNASFFNNLEGGGEVNFSPLKPWHSILEHTTPTNPPNVDSSLPDESALQLEWVHGYRAHDTRNTVHYTVLGDIVYCAGALCIVLNTERHDQRFMMLHTGAVCELTLHPGGKICASAEIGRRPRIIVWDVGTCQMLSALKGFHIRAVTSLAFSSNGKKLLSIGQDDWHSLVVYDWRTSVILHSSKTVRSKILSCHFRGNDDFITCGISHMTFWVGNDTSIRNHEGILGKIGKKQTHLCLATLEDDRVVSGTMTGHIYIWDGRNCSKTIKAHDKSVNALVICKHGLLSGGRDGRARLWSLPSIEPGAVFDLGGLGSFNPRIRSVSWSKDGGRLLIGTAGCEIYEISAGDGSNFHPGPVIQGHCKHELWGLAMNPTKPEYCTVGDDHSVRLWDLKTRALLKMVMLDTMARCCSYSPDGQVIVVGLGARIPGVARQKKMGAFVVLEAADLTIIHEARDSKEPLSELRFSQDGKTLAIATMDSSIYLYNVEDFTSKGRCKGHTGGVKNIDFSVDDQWLQSTCNQHEMLYWNAYTGEQHKAIGSLRDVEWASWTCSLGWYVQGIWPKFNDGVEFTTTIRSDDNTILATGDTFGRLRLWRFPVLEAGAACKTYYGHSDAVTNARFSPGDQYLVSVGNDRCIFQWKHVLDEVDDLADDYSRDLDSEDEQDQKAGSIWDRSIFVELVNGENMHSLFDLEEKAIAAEKAGDFRPVKPWRGSVVAPTNPPVYNLSAPQEKLELEWVHGYRSHDCRSNVLYAISNNIVTHIGKLAIVMNKDGGGLQRFMRRHSDDIIALAINPQQNLVATAEIGSVPQIVVWDVTTLRTVSLLRGYHRRGVNVVRFSRDGEQLLAAGLDDLHSVSIYNWKLGVMTACFPGGLFKIMAAEMTPNGLGVIQAGVKHIKFHSIQGRNIISQNGLLGKKGKNQTMLCIAWVGNRPVIGTENGELYIFEGRRLIQTVSAHSGSVNTLHSCSEGIASGGKDGFVKLWTTSLELKIEIKVSTLGSLCPSVRSVCWNPADNKVLIASRGAEIYEVNAANGNDINRGPVLQGHFTHELWGLSMHPQRKEFVTAGDDQTLRVWSLKHRQVLRQSKLDTMARACCYDPSGSKIIVGLGGRVGKGRQKKDGAFLVVNEDDLSVAHESRDAKQWISDIKFAPDQNTVAIASRDNKIYLYDVPSAFELKAVMDKHNSYVHQIDFSADSAYLQSCCGAFEYLCSDAEDGAAIPAISTLKDVRWDSWTLPIGWPVQGVWPKHSDGTDIRTCHRSNFGSLLLTGDNYGRLRLWKYPALDPDSGNKLYHGHGQDISKVRFAPEDDYAVSIGGKDRAIMQWKVLPFELDSALKAEDSGHDSDIDREGFFEDLDEDLEEFLAIKPWVGSTVPPTVPPLGVPTPPEMKLELEHVYGFRSKDVRNNLFYNANGSVVYHAAQIGIIYDKGNHMQQFYNKHCSGDIISLTVSPCGQYAASGDEGSRPTIHIWSALNGHAICVLPQYHRRAIGLISFSSDGKHLITIGQDNNHTHAIYTSLSGSWADPFLQATAKGSRLKTLFTSFIPHGDFLLVSGGTNQILFWTISGKCLESTSGIFGRKAKDQPLLCGATHGRKVVTGTVSGHLYVWEGTHVGRAIKAHDMSVNVLRSIEIGFISGGKEGAVKIWDTYCNPLKAFAIDDFVPRPHACSVRACDYDVARGVIVIGTASCEIYEVCYQSGRVSMFVEGHYRDELWGLATHPKSPTLFATSGDDCTIRVWDISARKMVKKIAVDTMVRAIDWSPDGATIGAGMGGNVGKGRQKKDGAMLVISVDSMSVIHQARDSREWISDVKFSPDGKSFAIGSNDNKIYVYDVMRDFALRAKCEKHHSYITHLDFSEDSNYIQSNCGGYELHFFNAIDGEHVHSPSTCKDVKWHTQTCTLGWYIQAIWPEYVDGVDILSTDRSSNNRFTSTTDSTGIVKVFRYPVLQKGVRCITARAHSSLCAKARFNADDKYLITIGGNDRTILQWRVLTSSTDSC